MSTNEANLPEYLLSSLKKSIPGWIITLQGTGNMELNRVVNDLHRLNHAVHHITSEGSDIRQQIMNLYRHIQAIKPRHAEPYHSRLSEVERGLANLRR
ncbi:MAG: hypothetical protein CL610_01570 [Anaerolineaceae bacterium]|nr:hypothetical protein [Anaerolineaceae bacterium]